MSLDKPGLHSCPGAPLRDSNLSAGLNASPYNRIFCPIKDYFPR